MDNQMITVMEKTVADEYHEIVEQALTSGVTADDATDDLHETAHLEHEVDAAVAAQLAESDAAQ